MIIPFTKNCNEILKLPVSSIIQTFSTNREKEAEKIVSCFYSCFKKEFIKWAEIKYRGIPEDIIQFIANTSFTDSVLLFSEKAKNGKIEDRNATVKTILWSFYWHKLREQLQKENRLSVKKEKFSKDNKYAGQWTEDSYQLAEERFLFLEQALAKMEPMDRQIIIWRHLELKSPVEIASILAITKDSASTKIYRCMQRLKNLINKDKESNEYQ